MYRPTPAKCPEGPGDSGSKRSFAFRFAVRLVAIGRGHMYVVTRACEHS